MADGSLDDTLRLARALSLATPTFGSSRSPLLEVEALHGLAGDFVRLVEPHTESHPAALLLQFLAAFGNAVGAGPHFDVERTAHRGNLFVCIVGDTAKARKGTSLGWVEHVMREAAPEWALRITSGLSSGEGVVQAVRDAPLFDEGDPGVSDKRLFIKESEFASVLKKMGRDGNSLSALLRDAWDSTHLQVLTRKDPLCATGAHVSLVTHVTREELRALMTATEQANGLANRFLWALVHRTKKLPHGGQLKADSPDLLSLISRVRTSVERATDRGLLDWAPAAKSLYGHVYGPLSDGLPGVLGKVTSRAEAQVTRLALLYALVDGAATIELAHLTAALAVWRFCLESARAIFGDGTGNKLADRFLAEMKAQGARGVGRAELHKLANNHAGKSDFDQALEVLETNGLAVKTSRRTAGAPAEVWFAIEFEPSAENDDRQGVAT